MPSEVELPREASQMSLIVVTGAPGTGKSTIAAALTAGLGWPLLALDSIKEALADVLGLGDEDWSNRRGDAAGGDHLPAVLALPCRGGRRLVARRTPGAGAA
jgi:AAA domain